MDKNIFTMEKNLYDKLLEAVSKLPDKAVERASKEITRKGYDTTGYQYQYLVNVMNEVCGIEGWGYEYIVAKEIEGEYRSRQKYYDITVDITVWILQNDNKIQRTAPGGHQSSSYADAKKGAVTNALKKALAMFGVGKGAYEGTLDEDYRPIDEPVAQKYGRTITIIDRQASKTKTGLTKFSLILEDGRTASFFNTALGKLTQALPNNKPINLDDEFCPIDIVQKGQYWNVVEKLKKVEEKLPIFNEEGDEVPFL